MLYKEYTSQQALMQAEFTEFTLHNQTLPRQD